MAYKRQTFVDKTENVQGTTLRAEHMNHIEDGIIDNELSRYSHFSIDDFYIAFKDITDNANTYTSIFDNETFAWFKTLHEQTGATVSCYCFYDCTADFTLDDITTKFKSDFQANSDWLKFGFHARTSNGNYANATYDKAKEDYELVVNALFKATGNVNCIDIMPRLHNFAGSLEACKGMRDAVCGVKGFLAAIKASDGSIRQSYYLGEEFNTYIHYHDHLYDASTQLHFVRTLDSVYELSKLLTNIDYANKSRFVESFTHENQLTSGTKNAILSAYKGIRKTHKPAFWQDIFK